jgi:hypothetical protein
METFILVIWLMRGQRFEETELPNLTWAQCTKHYAELLTERRPVRVTCVPDAPRLRIFQPGPDDRCLICPPNWPTLPPGHKRV